MKEVSRKGKYITLKCETNEDFKSMVEAMRINDICRLSDKQRLVYLRSMKIGVFETTLESAINKFWVSGQLSFSRLLSPIEIKILNLIYDYVSRTSEELLDEIDKHRSVVTENLIRLKNDGYIDKYSIYSGDKGRPKNVYKLTTSGSNILEYLRDHPNQLDF